MEDNEDENDEENSYTELEKIQKLLNVTKSIVFELVPGNLINLELKDFDWYLVEFT